ncbi:MAG TPA: class I SAM-dependent methyltransferase [Armatimonadota bacterium]|nr:class I SAM-dependent methyltransferase [Armatimonadota bacterium]
MDPQLADILREIEDASLQHGGMPKIARETGQFLNILIKSTGAKNILQVGAGDGYLALWMSEAVDIHGGKLACVEGDVWRFDLAKEMIDRSPYTDCVELMQGDPTEILAVIEGPFDFVLLNENKGQTLRYFLLLAEKISSGALVCCYPAMNNATALTDYLDYVHDTMGLESILVPIGDGIEMTYKVP